jgi:peptidyl-prolyl cis-trans isomerase B (cyclophilin B)
MISEFCRSEDELIDLVQVAARKLLGEPVAASAGEQEPRERTIPKTSGEKNRVDGERFLADKKLTPEEMKKMAETTAVIETKLGPNHVKNFVDLAKKGFYDGTLFHRVIPGFMIQGGDPNTKNPDRSKHGTGGPGYTVKAEFSDKPHKKGTLSMARAADPNSAGSQFFICVAPASFLDKQYTVFGEVVSGMDVADKIVSQPRDKRDNPNERIEIKARIVEKQ